MLLEENLTEMKKIILETANSIYEKENLNKVTNYDEVVYRLQEMSNSSEYLFEFLRRWHFYETEIAKMNKKELQELYRIFKTCDFIIGLLFGFPVIGNKYDFYNQINNNRSREKYEEKDAQEKNKAIKMYASRNYELSLYNKYDLDLSIENLEGSKYTFKRDFMDLIEKDLNLNKEVMQIKINNNMKKKIDKVFTCENILEQMESFVNSFNKFSLNDVKYFLQKCQQNKIILSNDILDEIIYKCEDKFDQDLMIRLFMSSFNMSNIGSVNVIQIKKTGTLAKIFLKTENDVKINFELLRNIFSRVDNETLSNEDLLQVLSKCIPTFKINHKLIDEIVNCCKHRSLSNDIILLLLKQTDYKVIFENKIFYKFSSLEFDSNDFSTNNIQNPPTPELLKELFRCSRDIIYLKENIAVLVNACEGNIDLDFVKELFKFISEDDIIFYDNELFTFLSKCNEFEMDYDLAKKFLQHSKNVPFDNIVDFLNKCTNVKEKVDNDLVIRIFKACAKKTLTRYFLKTLLIILKNNNKENSESVLLNSIACKCFENRILDAETLSNLLDCGFYFSERVFEENLSIFAEGLFEGNFSNNLTCSKENKDKFVSTYNDWNDEKKRNKEKINLPKKRNGKGKRKNGKFNKISDKKRKKTDLEESEEKQKKVKDEDLKNNKSEVKPNEEYGNVKDKKEEQKDNNESENKEIIEANNEDEKINVSENVEKVKQKQDEEDGKEKLKDKDEQKPEKNEEENKLEEVKNNKSNAEEKVEQNEEEKKKMETD